jgi:hypothetical protein
LASHSGGQLCRIETIDFRVRQQYQRSIGKKPDAPPRCRKDTGGFARAAFPNKRYFHIQGQTKNTYRKRAKLGKK